MDKASTEQQVTLVREHWRKVDEGYARHFESHPPPDCTVCHKAYCCRQLVLCTEQEASLIRDTVRRWSAGKKRALERRLSALPNEARESFAGDCPFLADERCQVYAVRPLACRAFHSTNKSRCKRRIKSPDAGLFSALSEHNRQLRERLEQAGGHAKVVALAIWMKYHWKD